jgi:hypothetical protein
MFWNSPGPKHVEVTNKTDEIYCEYCASVWFHLQDYIETHGQQNIEIKCDFFNANQHKILALLGLFCS